MSSGSACDTGTRKTSEVLRRVCSEREAAQGGVRFSFGRFTTEEEIDYAIDLVKSKIGKLRDLSPLWEMYKDGIDLNSVQWAAH